MGRHARAAMIALAIVGATPARADWLRAESPKFIVYSESSAALLRRRILLLEEFDRLLRLLTGTTAPPSPNRLTVYLVHGPLEMQRIAPVTPSTGGFYRAAPDGIIAVSDETTNWRSNEDDTLFHEYAHHFMMQYHPAPYPTWYSEGFAEYVMTASIRAGYFEYGRFNLGRAAWLTARHRWIPYEEILFGDLRRVDPGLFYAQSWLLVHYIMADAGRRAALVRYVQALARGDDARTSFVAAFGMQPADVDRAMRDYGRRITYHRITRSRDEAQPTVTIQRLGGAAIELPLIEAALTIGVERPNRATVLARARRAGRGDDAFGRRVQAHAELLYGDPAVADQLLDGLIAAAPRDAALLYLKGLRHLVAGRRDPAIRAAEFRLAQGYFARAHRLDPNHFPTLFRYAESLSQGDQLVTENTQNILLLASHLAPQVNQIRLAAAHVLLLRGQFDHAQALLLPLITSLHDTDDAARARALLALARSRQRPTDTDVFRLNADPGS